MNDNINEFNNGEDLTENNPATEIPPKDTASFENNGYTVTPDGNFYNSVLNTVPAKETAEVYDNNKNENKSSDDIKTPLQSADGITDIAEENATGTDFAVEENENAEEKSANENENQNENGVKTEVINDTVAPNTAYNEGYYQGGYYHYAYKKANNVSNAKPNPVKNKKSYGIGTVIVAVVLSAIIGVAAASAVFNLKYKDKTNTVTITKDGTQTTINVDETASSVIEAVAEKAGPSVVGIRTTTAYVNFFGGSSESTGEGSGVVYSSDGYIITNYHVLESVIESASLGKIDVYVNNDTSKSYSATVIGYNISYDLAVIKISNANLTAVEIGKSDSVKVGQFVAAIGCPGGLEFMGSVSYGVVSGLNRITNPSSQESVALIQTDAAINPGNSGGALLNTKGQLIGINSSKIASTEYEGMGFAIPVDTVVDICDNIIAKKDDPTPYTGITLSETYDQTTLNSLGYPSGAVVSSVADGSPAQNAGIRRGDIITEWNGSKITNYDGLYSKINDSKVGSAVTVKIYRSGRYYTTTVKITSNNAK